MHKLMAFVVESTKGRCTHLELTGEQRERKSRHGKLVWMIIVNLGDGEVV